MPPSRKRLPAATCFSATSLGDEKNTIESRMALSTRATAMASTANALPIRTRRRCLRVICASTSKAELLQLIVQFLQAQRITGQRASRVAGRSNRLVAITEHKIGPDQAHPAVEIVAILLQPRRETVDHA